MKYVILFLIFSIIIFMPIQTWEGLQKSATDPTTLSEYIADQIALHEADPEAHLGVGESLEAHKTADVIDHPAQSVVADKLFGGDIVIKTQFESLDPWSKTGTVFTDGFNGLVLYTEYGAVNTSKVSASMYGNGYLFNAVSDIYFETQFANELSNSHFNAWLGFLNGYVTTTTGFGFQIRDGVVYAHVRRGTSYTDVTLAGVSLSSSHFFSALFSFADQKVYFKIDGVLVATIDVPAGTSWDDDRTPAFGITLTQSNDGNSFVGYLYAWRKVLTS
jgi:hypothetical protein